ncbi:MAG: Gfo/Idh/MocA family oxidoreductase [Coriobacteriales bacterium]|jgi:predicted dehydrogenase|nr:Gfo/Idh/MocA family oxidoreductase [Coriobacteriales bacterium]
MKLDPQNVLKAGVVGVGNMGRNHLRVLSTMPQFELIGCFDVDRQARQQCARHYGIRAFDTEQELFEQVDVAHIVVPSHLHRQLAVLAAKQGCHVLVEKPIALNLEDAQRIIDACQASGTKLCVGHVERFNPAVVSLENIVAHEKMISVDFRRMSPFSQRMAGTSVVMDLMIHDIDVLLNICPRPVEHISCQGARIFTDMLDYAQALIRFDNGLLASLTASRVTESKIRKAQINAKSAFINVDYLNRSVEISRQTHFTLDVGYQLQYKQDNIIEKVFVPLDEPLRAEFACFANSITTGDPVVPSGEMGKRALELCLRIEAEILKGLR